MGMEMKQPIKSKAPKIEKMFEKNTINFNISSTSRTCDKKPCSLGISKDEYCSFGILEMDVPKVDSEEVRLSWLCSQIIGYNVSFDSPFGKRRLTYADQTASAQTLHYIENFIINNVLPFYGNTHTSDSHVGKRTTKMVNEAARYIKKCLGGGQEDALLFCGSGTTAAIKKLQEVMGITVPSILRERVLNCLKKEERWVVFIGPYEHHSNLLSWRQSLVDVVEIGLDENGLLDIEALRLQLESYKDTNRPILGSFSACSNVTGLYTDTRAVAKLLHQYGGFVCFDFAASGPYVKIDLRSGEIDGYDAIFLSPHKFIGGPGTPGILLMSKALYQIRSLPPSTCGGGTVAYVNGFNEKDTLYYEDIEERENGGTPQIIQTIRAAMAFWIKEYIGFEVIEKQEHIYAEKALKRFLPNKNIKVLGDTSAKRQAILSFLIYSTTNSSLTDLKTGFASYSKDKGDEPLYMWKETGHYRDKPLHGPFIATLLNDLFGIQARGGCACAGPYGHALLKIDETRSLTYRSAIQKGYNGLKPGWTRISFPYYMSKEEFEFILAAVEFIAIYGQRFLPLYDLNWRTGSWVFKKKAFKDLMNNTTNAQSLVFSTSSNALQPITRDIKCKKIEDKENTGLVSKFASYLETATKIARFLPKFPPQRTVPDNIDIDLLYFRV